MKQMQQRYQSLGYSFDYRVFLGIHLLLSGIFFFLFLLFPYGFVVAPLGSLLFFFSFSFLFIDIPFFKKAKRLEKDASIFFTVFLIHLKNKKNIKQALEVTCSFVDNSLTKEFAYVLKDSFVGDGFLLRLETLVKRCPSVSVKHLFLLLLEGVRVGDNMIFLFEKELASFLQMQEEERLRNYRYVFYKMGIYTLLAFIGMISLFFVFCTFL